MARLLPIMLLALSVSVAFASSVDDDVLSMMDGRLSEMQAESQRLAAARDNKGVEAWLLNDDVSLRQLQKDKPNNKSPPPKGQSSPPPATYPPPAYGAYGTYPPQPTGSIDNAPPPPGFGPIYSGPVRARIPITVTFQADCSEVLRTTTSAARFTGAVRATLADSLNIDPEMVSVTGLACGSVVVNADILADDSTTDSQITQIVNTLNNNPSQVFNQQFQQQYGISDVAVRVDPVVTNPDNGATGTRAAALSGALMSFAMAAFGAVLLRAAM